MIDKKSSNELSETEQIVSQIATNNDTVDWQQVRIQAAIAAMHAKMGIYGGHAYAYVNNIAEDAVKQADALVEELKKD